MNNFERYFFTIVIAFMMAMCMVFFCIAVVSLVDSLTAKEIGKESVPCIDEYNRPFEDEMCTKTIRCSWLGFVGDEKCNESQGEINTTIEPLDKLPFMKITVEA